jgi:hypothetical protein
VVLKLPELPPVAILGQLPPPLVELLDDDELEELLEDELELLEVEVEPLELDELELLDEELEEVPPPQLARSIVLPNTLTVMESILARPELVVASRRMVLIPAFRFAPVGAM